MNLYDRELKPCIPHPTKPDELLFLLIDFTQNFKNIFNNFLTLGLPWGPMDPKTIFNLMDLLHLLSAGYGTP